MTAVGEPEEWAYLDHAVLRPSRSARVCITCRHFSYEVSRSCVTLLTRRCRHWSARPPLANP